jgi:hypothetical protein
MSRRRRLFRRWPDSDAVLWFLTTPQFAVLYVVLSAAFFWWWHS